MENRRLAVYINEDLRYIIFYVPGGEEKEFLAKK